MSDEHDKHEGGGHGGGGHGGGGHGGGHGGGGGHAEGEHEGAPEWLISFADNVALMMGLFVVLLAMNMKPAEDPAPSARSGGGAEESEEVSDGSSAQMLDWAIAMREAFNNPVSADNPRDSLLYRRMQQRSAQSEDKSKDVDGTGQSFKAQRPSDYIAYGGVVQFEAESVSLDEEAASRITRLAEERLGMSNVIELRGHVSSAEAFSRKDRGMQLSYDRAKSVADALAERGVEWQRLRVTACGDNERVVGTAYDAAGHSANQRVEVVDTDKKYDSDSAPRNGAPGPAADAGAPAAGGGH